MLLGCRRTQRRRQGAPATSARSPISPWRRWKPCLRFLPQPSGRNTEAFCWMAPWDTLIMVVISTIFAYLIGLPLGCLADPDPAPRHLAPPRPQPRSGHGSSTSAGPAPSSSDDRHYAFYPSCWWAPRSVSGAPSPPGGLPPPPSSPGWWKPLLPRWTPVWWKPPSPWAHPFPRSSGRSTCRRQSPPWCWAVPSPSSPFWPTLRCRCCGCRRPGRHGHPVRL